MDPSLGDVLRLVLDAGLAAPADEEEHRDRVHRRIGERKQRVHRVADARVLEVDDRQSCPVARW